MPTLSQLTTTTTPADTDILLVVDTAGVPKSTTLGTILNKSNAQLTSYLTAATVALAVGTTRHQQATLILAADVLNLTLPVAADFPIGDKIVVSTEGTTHAAAIVVITAPAGLTLAAGASLTLTGPNQMAEFTVVGTVIYNK